MNSLSSVLEVTNLSVWFSERQVLSDIHLSLFPGELTVLIGHSGSGKSTLLQSINRLNEIFPVCRTQGEVQLCTERKKIRVYQSDVPLSEIRRRIGMVFQTPAVLPFSIFRNVAMPVRITLGYRGNVLNERVEWALRQVSLWDEVKDRLHKNASTLSGGQQQRLCLARTLALEPDVLLLDEPTASLDFKSARKIEALLGELKTRYAILVVSHSLGQTLRVADRVCVIRDGRMVREMGKQELRNPAEFYRVIETYF